MGDMADFALDTIIIDFSNHTTIKKSTCKYCLQKGLEWVQTNKGFRLFNKDNELHSCEKYKQK